MSTRFKTLRQQACQSRPPERPPRPASPWPSKQLAGPIGIRRRRPVSTLQDADRHALKMGLQHSRAPGFVQAPSVSPVPAAEFNGYQQSRFLLSIFNSESAFTWVKISLGA